MTARKEDGTYTTCDTASEQVPSEGLPEPQTVAKKPERLGRKVYQLEEAFICSKELERLTLRFESLLQRTEKAAYVMRLDEYVFCMCLLCLLVSLILQMYLSTIIKVGWICIMNLMYFTVRVAEFKWKNWSYFFYDGNSLLTAGCCLFLLFVRVEMTVCMLLVVSVAQSVTVPLTLFRPRTIFFERVRITAFYLHYSPLLVCCFTRYYKSSTRKHGTLVEAVHQMNEAGWRSQLHVFLLGLGFYAGWVLFYYLFIFHFRSRSIDKINQTALAHYTVDHQKLFALAAQQTGRSAHAFLHHMTIHLSQAAATLLLSLFVLGSDLLTGLVLVAHFTLPLLTQLVGGPEEASRPEARSPESWFERRPSAQRAGRSPVRSRSAGKSPPRKTRVQPLKL